MVNAESSAPILNLASAPGQTRVRGADATQLADEAAAERLHWALRASFRALLNPRVWFRTRERRAWGAA